MWFLKDFHYFSLNLLHTHITTWKRVHTCAQWDFCLQILTIQLPNVSARKEYYQWPSANQKSMQWSNRTFLHISMWSNLLVRNLTVVDKKVSYLGPGNPSPLTLWSFEWFSSILCKFHQLWSWSTYCFRILVHNFPNSFLKATRQGTTTTRIQKACYIC